MIERKQKAPLKSVRNRKKTNLLIQKAKSKSRSDIRKQKKLELFDQITTRSPQTKFMNSFKNKTRKLNLEIKQKIDEVNLRINQQKVQMIKEMENEAKRKIRQYRNQHSMDAIKQKYLQKKTVSPHTLNIKQNEDIHFVETHCFCIPKHLAHHFHDPKPLIKKNKELLQQKLQKEKIREAQYQNAKFNQQRSKLYDYDKLDEQVEEQKSTLLAQLLEAQQKEFKMQGRIKKLRKKKGNLKMNQSQNDFQNKDMLLEFEKNNKKLYREIQKSKSALNLQKKKQKMRFQNNKKKMYKLKKRIHSQENTQRYLQTFENFDGIDKNQNLASTDFTQGEGDSYRYVQNNRNQKLYENQKNQEDQWEKLQKKSLSQSQLDRINKEGNEQIHEIYKLNKNPKYHDNFMKKQIPKIKITPNDEQNEMNGGKYEGGQQVNKQNKQNLDFVRQEEESDIKNDKKNKSKNKSKKNLKSSKNLNPNIDNSFEHQVPINNNGIDYSQRSLNGKVMIRSQKSEDDDCEDKEGFIADYDYLGKYNDQGKYEFTGISEKDLQRIQESKRHSKSKQGKNLDYVKEQDQNNINKRFTFNNDLPIQKEVSKKDSNAKDSVNEFEQNGKYSIVNDSDKHIPNYSFHVDKFNLNKDSRIDNTNLDSNNFDNNNDQQQLFSLVSSQLYGADSQFLSSLGFLKDTYTFDKDSEQHLPQNINTYNQIMQNYLTGLYGNIMLQQLLKENPLNLTASWNMKEGNNSQDNENNINEQNFSNVNKDYLLASFNLNKSDVQQENDQKQKKTKSKDDNDDMFMNSKLSFGAEDQSKLDKGVKQGSIKDFVKRNSEGTNDDDKKLSNRYFEKNSDFNINTNLKTQEFAADNTDQMFQESGDNSLKTDYGNYSNSKQFQSKDDIQFKRTELSKKFDEQTKKELFKKKNQKDSNKKDSTNRKKISTTKKNKTTQKNVRNKSISKTFKEDNNKQKTQTNLKKRQSSQIKSGKKETQKNKRNSSQINNKSKKQSNQNVTNTQTEGGKKTHNRNKSSITKTTIIKNQEQGSKKASNTQKTKNSTLKTRKKSTIINKKLHPEQNKKQSIFQNQDLKGVDQPKDTTKVSTKRRSTIKTNFNKKSTTQKLRPSQGQNQNSKNKDQSHNNNFEQTLKVDYQSQNNDYDNDQNLEDTIRKNTSKTYDEDIGEEAKRQNSTSNLSVHSHNDTNKHGDTQINRKHSKQTKTSRNTSMNQKKDSKISDSLQVGKKSIEGSQRISRKKIGSYMDINKQTQDSQVKIQQKGTIDKPSRYEIFYRLQERIVGYFQQSSSYKI